jgi:thiol-disulfide isomerase/thioredoxin
MQAKLRRLIAAGAVVVGLGGCAGTGNDPNSVANGGFQPGSQVNYYSPTDRSTVGDVSGQTLHGTPISLSSYRGKIVVVNYWSSTCAPCQAESQAFQALSKKFASKGVKFVGIDERDNLAEAIAFERGNHVTYPSIYDRMDAFVLAFPRAAPSSTPFTIILDRQGGIAAKSSSPLDYTTLQSLLNHVLGESA